MGKKIPIQIRQNVADPSDPDRICNTGIHIIYLCQHSVVAGEPVADEGVLGLIELGHPHVPDNVPECGHLQHAVTKKLNKQSEKENK